MTARNERGTFRKGTSGNPAGRPRMESLSLRNELAKHGDKVAQVVIEAALGGDMQAAKIVMERLCPPLKPSAQPVTINLPENPGIAETARAIITHAADGKLPPDVAGQLVQSVAALARVIEIDELERRLSALEEKHDK